VLWHIKPFGLAESQPPSPSPQHPHRIPQIARYPLYIPLRDLQALMPQQPLYLFYADITAICQARRYVLSKSMKAKRSAPALFALY
jgi:hypothetical protein